MPGYKVLFDDLFHCMDPEKRFVGEIGVFPTFEEAVAVCKRIIDEQLDQWAERDITADKLQELYVSFADDPFIVPDEVLPKGTDFSFWDYVKERSEALAKQNATK